MNRRTLGPQTSLCASEESISPRMLATDEQMVSSKVACRKSTIPESFLSAAETFPALVPAAAVTSSFKRKHGTLTSEDAASGSSVLAGVSISFGTSPVSLTVLPTEANLIIKKRGRPLGSRDSKPRVMRDKTKPKHLGRGRPLGKLDSCRRKSKACPALTLCQEGFVGSMHAQPIAIIAQPIAIIKNTMPADPMPIPLAQALENVVSTAALRLSDSFPSHADIEPKERPLFCTTSSDRHGPTSSNSAGDTQKQWLPGATLGGLGNRKRQLPVGTQGVNCPLLLPTIQSDRYLSASLNHRVLPVGDDAPVDAASEMSSPCRDSAMSSPCWLSDDSVLCEGDTSRVAVRCTDVRWSDGPPNGTAAGMTVSFSDLQPPTSNTWMQLPLSQFPVTLADFAADAELVATMRQLAALMETLVPTGKSCDPQLLTSRDVLPRLPPDGVEDAVLDRRSSPKAILSLDPYSFYETADVTGHRVKEMYLSFTLCPADLNSKAVAGLAMQSEPC